MTVDSLNMALTRIKEKSNKISKIFLAIFFTFIFGNVFFLKWVKRDFPEFEWLSGVVLVIAFSYGGWFLWKLSKIKKVNLPHCPECNSVIIETQIPVVIASGNCTCCGKSIVDKSV